MRVTSCEKWLNADAYLLPTWEIHARFLFFPFPYQIWHHSNEKWSFDVYINACIHVYFTPLHITLFAKNSQTVFTRVDRVQNFVEFFVLSESKCCVVWMWSWTRTSVSLIHFVFCAHVENSLSLLIHNYVFAMRVYNKLHNTLLPRNKQGHWFFC